MRPKNKHKLKNKGTVLILAMIFLAAFSALAVAAAALTGTNLQISKNQQMSNQAFTAAESGISVLRYWLAGLSVPGDTPNNQKLSMLAQKLQEKLDFAGISNINPSYDLVTQTITIPEVPIDPQKNRSFSAKIEYDPSNFLSLTVTGSSSQFNKTIAANFSFNDRANPIFNYGVASKGPMEISGNVDLELLVNASVYIESVSTDLALAMFGNSEITTNVSIYNPYATVNLIGNSKIGGEKGTEAIENHVFTGVEQIDFPTPQTDQFYQYTQNVIDANTDTTQNLTMDNVLIKAGTDPHFTGSTNFSGIVFIEQPNVVIFGGNATITGLIVTDGTPYTSSLENQIIFEGDTDSYGVSELPDEQKFAGLKNKTGTFMLAPGFKTFFGGNTGVINGTIAADGLVFYGNASGQLNGTILNYSSSTLTATGNTNMLLTPSGTDDNPAGFTPVQVLEFDQSSYSEIAG